MSFFDQDTAIMEIELPRQKVQQLKHRLSKGIKYAVKLEFKNNQVELHIIDEQDQVYKLNGFTQKSENNLWIQGDQPIGIVQYKSKSAQEDINNFDESESYESRAIIEQEDSADENNPWKRKQDRFKLFHKDIKPKIEEYRSVNHSDPHEINVIKGRLDHFLRQQPSGATIKQIQEDFKYSEKDLKILLKGIADKQRIGSSTYYKGKQ